MFDVNDLLRIGLIVSAFIFCLWLSWAMTHDYLDGKKGECKNAAV